MCENRIQPVFLSYGRADALEFAGRLAHDLKNHTLSKFEHYEPWKDRVAIQRGGSWADQILAALRGVAGVVAIMSPHAVRTRAAGSATADSVCLDEISSARFAAQKPIVPVMLIQCEPPFEIFRRDYVDFTGWKEEQEYHRALEKLLCSIGAALRGEIRYRSRIDRLQPWDFGAFLESKRRGFIGREWLFNKIARWATESGEPALLVVGDAGIGKSAIIAEFVHRNPKSRVIAYHCCQANVLETLAPGRFVRSIAAMIASRHPAYEALLDQSPYRDVLNERRCDEDPESAFEEGVLAALQRVGPPSSDMRFLMIDALDEGLLLRKSAPVNIVRLLAQRIRRFPVWLRLVATSRDQPEVLQNLASLDPLLVQAKHPENLKDLEDYIAGRMAREPLATKLRHSNKDTAWALTTLSGLAQGNFLYAQQALDAVAGPKFTINDLGKLPPGLSEQFQWFFERQFDLGQDWASVVAVFEVLLAAQAPIAESELSAATGLDPEAEVPQVRIAAALREARTAAHNVQDLVFCARTVSHVTALTENWWTGALPSAVAVAAVVERFSAKLEAPEFAATHVVGERYTERHVVNVTSRLPDWLLQARSLNGLARAYQWPLSAFIALNPGIPSPEVELAEGTRVRVPDPRWAPMLAAYFAGLVLRAAGLSREERAGLILKLLPRAASNFTALDTVLARLLLALRPTESAVLAQLERSLGSYSWVDVTLKAAQSPNRRTYEPLA